VAQMGIQMRFLVMMGMLFSIGVGSAHAQASVGTFGGSVGAGSINNAGSLGRNGGMNGASSATGSLPAPLVRKNADGTNPGQFVPSKYESYAAAVEMGENAMHARPPTVVEAAQMAQKEREAGAATKPAIVLEKNSDGKLIVVQPSVQPRL
jgi:hypothetical protein